MHAAGVVVGAGSSVVLWLAFRQPWYSVLSNFAITVAFNEIQVLTQPLQLVNDWHTYQQDRWRTIATGRPRPSTVRVSPLVWPGGAGVNVQF